MIRRSDLSEISLQIVREMPDSEIRNRELRRLDCLAVDPSISFSSVSNPGIGIRQIFASMDKMAHIDMVNFFYDLQGLKLPHDSQIIEVIEEATGKRWTIKDILSEMQRYKRTISHIEADELEKSGWITTDSITIAARIKDLLTKPKYHTDERRKEENFPFTLVEQVRLLSAGTIAGLTGEKRYDRIDRIRLEFLRFVEKNNEFRTWQEAWNAFAENKDTNLCACCGTNDNCDWVKSGDAEECCICENLPYEDWCNGCKVYNPRIEEPISEGVRKAGEKFVYNGNNKSIHIDGYENSGKSWRIWGTGKIFKGKFYNYWQIWIPKSISLLLWNTQCRNQIMVPKWFYEKSMKVYYRKEAKK